MTPFVIITFNTITYSHFPSYVYKPHFIFNLDKILKTFYSFIYFPCVFLFISLFCIRSIGSIKCLFFILFFQIKRDKYIHN